MKFDRRLLNWLERHSDKMGHWVTISIHDSRDMGYTENFVSVKLSGGVEGRGSSLREALCNAEGLNFKP